MQLKTMELIQFANANVLSPKGTRSGSGTRGSPEKPSTEQETPSIANKTEVAVHHRPQRENKQRVQKQRSGPPNTEINKRGKEKGPTASVGILGIETDEYNNMK
ncbi:Hypothetical predicted protein [Pelobates cultripes]|uniref:Uncharacterized protein n=1 Tax=Pelobates cultripes TaxID=61616 RepID=A0AAD1W994_PELCU|nr:Hypothetical predicted protein [Pelobates cultripes]